jgi:hypothetical protein
MLREFIVWTAAAETVLFLVAIAALHFTLGRKP